MKTRAAYENMNEQELLREEKRIEESMEPFFKFNRIMFLLCVGGFVCLFIGLVSDNSSLMKNGWWFFLITLIIVCSVPMLLKGKHKEIKKIRAAIERLAENEKEKNKQEIESGNWAFFPAKKFYEDCIANGIKNLDSRFYVQKATIIGNKLLEEAGIPEDCRHLYTTEENLKKHFIAQQAREKQEAEEAQRKKEEWAKTPHKSNPAPVYKKCIETAKLMFRAKGREMIEIWFRQEIKFCNTFVEKDRKTIEELDAASMAVLKSGHYIKPVDWAIVGGAVSGLAGGAAGAMAAINTMAKNQEIDTYNQLNAALAVNLSTQISNAAIEEKKNLKRHLDKVGRLEKALAELQMKVVLDDVSSEELVSAIEIGNYGTETYTTQDNLLAVHIDVRNRYTPNVPEGVTIVVHGVIEAEVFSGDIKVGDVYIPLPETGIECGKKAQRVYGYCEYYMEGKTKYFVKVKRMNLFAMEA